jgi:hypothetical protein
MSRASPVLLALAVGCARVPAGGPAADASAAPSPARFRVEDAPRELQPTLALAEAALKSFRERLLARLSAELASAGVGKALAVCQREAPALAEAVSAQTGVLVGRIGAHLRPGASPPRPWIAPALEEATARRAADVQEVALDLGDRVALLRPIRATALCLACHGPPERVPPEVKLAADGGPVAYAEGDLRGFFWAEAPKEKR